MIKFSKLLIISNFINDFIVLEIRKLSKNAKMISYSPELYIYKPDWRGMKYFLYRLDWFNSPKSDYPLFELKYSTRSEYYWLCKLPLSPLIE